MIQNFTERKEVWAKLGSKKIVGVGMERVFAANAKALLLYADGGRRYGLGCLKPQQHRCFEIGIAEQNMIGVAAGLCHEGYCPFAVTNASFITGRAFDQVKANIGDMNLPIKLIGSASGLGAADLGPLLTCTDDIATMRVIPHMIVISPADCTEVIKCMDAVANLDAPVYIRLTGSGYVTPVYQADYNFEIGKAVKLQEGGRVLIITHGALTSAALGAAKKLQNEGMPPAVINMHTVKPLDTKILDTYLNFDYFVTVEEHSVIGGLGGAVAEYLSDKRCHPGLVRIGIQDTYFLADHRAACLEKIGLTEDGIYTSIKNLF